MTVGAAAVDERAVDVEHEARGRRRSRTAPHHQLVALADTQVEIDGRRSTSRSRVTSGSPPAAGSPAPAARRRRRGDASRRPARRASSGAAGAPRRRCGAEPRARSLEAERLERRAASSRRGSERTLSATSGSSGAAARRSGRGSSGRSRRRRCAQRSASITLRTAWVATNCETGVTMIG